MAESILSMKVQNQVKSDLPKRLRLTLENTVCTVAVFLGPGTLVFSWVVFPNIENTLFRLRFCKFSGEKHPYVKRCRKCLVAKKYLFFH